MGLYLCVFDGDEEVDGVEVGPYADFNELRNYIIHELELGQAGIKFPTFINHSDSDGEWSVADCVKLNAELSEIVLMMKTKPPVPFVSEWQSSIAKSTGLVPKTAYESFIDVDGELVLKRIGHLVDVALQYGLPILFQ
ncbi:Imm70 family immunity protein [Methylomonas methanica]|uniref:Uncharacterized protein n=1 Tax=Methylomonas methanica (strain DSM 25384 / MC09) TaxID=857087 RepID=F9ZVR4_METMM|nr:Imm70 family immunity protein [Methylomonas methanica]AEF99542.1 hypothetical protein Metme_1108 [Methylomonas methanica MC09]